MVSRQVRALLATGVLLAAGSATARPVFMEIGDIKGESTDDAAADGHKQWIEIQSLRIVPEMGAPEMTGGVNVAVGDLNGDGASAAPSAPPPKPPPLPRPGDVTLKRGVADVPAAGASPGGTNYGPVITIKPKGDEEGARDIAAPGPEPVPIGLLLPAVQKVREARAARPAGLDCRVGPLGHPIAVRDSTTGREGRILDPAIASCSAEEISLNFSKIEWPG